MWKRNKLLKIMVTITVLAGLLSLIICLTPHSTPSNNTGIMEASDNFVASLTSEGYIEGNYIVTSERGGYTVYQDEAIISEAEVYIPHVPLPCYYSEYNGEPLATDNVNIRVAIDIFDFRTGEARLSARATIPDVNPMDIRLLYKEPDVITANSSIYFCPNEQFTFDELRTHPEYFYWEKDRGWY